MSLDDYRIAETEFAGADVSTVHINDWYRTAISYGTGNVDFDEDWPNREAAVAGHDRIVAMVRDKGYASGSCTRACPKCGVDAYYGSDEWGHCGACHYAGTQPDEDDGDDEE